MRTDQAYDECVRLTRKHARNFFYGIRLLPPPKRRALSAVYAVARRIDDIGDGVLPAEQKLEALENTRKDLHNLDRITTDPALVALRDSAQCFGLPLEAFDELIDGCRADVLGARYATFADLHHYCRCVAGSIGRLSLAVFGTTSWSRTQRIADDLGVALQLTNIVRDVLEDRMAGRIYLPSEDLRRFGCSLDLDEAEFLRDDTEALLALLEYQMVRAQEWYRRGLALLPTLDHRSRACCAAMTGIYYRLLQAMVLRPERVLHGRTTLSAGSKLVLAARACAGGRP